MNDDVNGNRKLFWKEVCEGGNVENCSRIKGGKGKLAYGIRRIWKEYFKGLYNIHTQEQVAVHVWL